MHKLTHRLEVALTQAAGCLLLTAYGYCLAQVAGLAA